MDPQYLKPESLEILVNLEEVCELLPDHESSIRVAFDRGAAGELGLEFMPEHLDIGYELGMLFYGLESKKDDQRTDLERQVAVFSESHLAEYSARLARSSFDTKRRFLRQSHTINAICLGQQTRAEGMYVYALAMKDQVRNSIYDGDLAGALTTLSEMGYVVHTVERTLQSQALLGTHSTITPRHVDKEIEYIALTRSNIIDAMANNQREQAYRIEVAVAHQDYEVAGQIRDELQ